MRVSLLLLAASVSVMLLAWSKTPDRLLTRDEAAASRGGLVCALNVVNTTGTCHLRSQLVGGTYYRCDGNNLDQVCSAAHTNTNNVCYTASATCSGNQEKFNTMTGQWVADGSCNKATYQSALLKAGVCTPVGP